MHMYIYYHCCVVFYNIHDNLCLLFFMVQPSATENGPYDYTRSGNPTRDVLERFDVGLCFVLQSWIIHPCFIDIMVFNFAFSVFLQNLIKQIEPFASPVEWLL